ncbi:NADH-ubiquinone oxidoreductase-F iron-sulfur binding region domain-containing protein [Sporomusa sp.]|uniref:NADH-ubiquinone oxidoreductase-F iron-sulfur binding region domain-containing protein n=1 Tax=Sporomusa sp. TaxID=2078658 RepID=UPI002C6A2D58|nr:NADH-ubiquinone oxidoreductase-F iron-sulfur binding region domain-containing protein [Sporomusa sp.]HWR45506.1 NADH-ubiquinone oxidoreductase-F iron-sulfur binding region domain-containing protein [Sporomusa sp.]
MIFEQLQPSALTEWKMIKDSGQPRYSGLAKALKMTPAEVIEEINKSGLRGRGGAGFFTAAKWHMCQAASGSEKYLICNAADGDLAAPVGRWLLESNPHAVLEGMLIGAYAVGANRGYIYINAASQSMIEWLQTALAQMLDNGLMGENILDSGLSFHIKIKAEACDLLSGEETAMLRKLEGKLPMPSLRPPYPAVAGLKGKPTLINNAETLAHVSAIFQKGADWYAGIGSKESRGTKLLVLAGKVANSGIVEVPMGITLRQVIYDIGGGVAGDKELKAVFIGGPSGGCLPDSALDISLDYESLATEGGIIGSGGIVVADKDTCIVDFAKECLAITKAASCGKCVLCREGTTQMLEILTDITAGKGRPEDVDLLIELGEGIKAGSLCAYGKTAPSPVLTTIKHFREEYEAHIKRKRCPALVCKKYISYHILGDKCQGCQVCMQECPVGAIDGGGGLIHVIDQDNCDKCGRCQEVCPAEYSAVTKAGSVKPKTPDEPIPVGTWKKKR